VVKHWTKNPVNLNVHPWIDPQNTTGHGPAKASLDGSALSRCIALDSIQRSLVI